MDPVSQIALGAAVGHALAGRRLGGLAAAGGALGGLIPDLDVIWSGWGRDTIAYWELHRGVTHSLFFGPVVGPVLGWASATLHGRARAKSGKPTEGLFAAWTAVWVGALFTHPLLDTATIYGTQLLAPFSDLRFALPALPIIDPIYTLPLLVALGLAAFLGWRTGAAKRVTVAALVLTTLYAGAGLWANGRAEAIARADPGLVARAPEEVRVTTTFLTPWLRRVTTQEADARHVGFVSVFAPERPIRWTALPKDPRAEALAEAALATEQGRRYRRFATGALNPHVVESPDGEGEVLRIGDARYGFPNGTLGGMWGVQWPIRDGAIVEGAAERYMIPRGADLDDLGDLLSASFGGETELF
ncbi:metal-dependent hydrolase [Salinarimonas ramus]|uniref:Membrane protein n=1 Tax=Salinarimonas ramus TaxID=690164 RepID=A0A917QH91_9HYPH|nr:metal-dependent hydrolase [Salinarimonas ramus]GGK50373.1 membrane protein [Salinarimonas ramus]